MIPTTAQDYDYPELIEIDGEKCYTPYFKDHTDYLFLAEQSVCQHAYKDHFHCESHAGPDSGWDHFECQICGWEDHHTYY